MSARADCCLQEELKREKAAETMRYVADFVADREARREEERRAEFESERKIQVRAFSLAGGGGGGG